MNIIIRFLITTLIVIICAILGSIVPENLKYVVGFAAGSIITCLLYFYVFKEDK